MKLRCKKKFSKEEKQEEFIKKYLKEHFAKDDINHKVCTLSTLAYLTAVGCVYAAWLTPQLAKEILVGMMTFEGVLIGGMLKLMYPTIKFHLLWKHKSKDLLNELYNSKGKEKSN